MHATIKVTTILPDLLTVPLFCHVVHISWRKFVADFILIFTSSSLTGLTSCLVCVIPLACVVQQRLWRPAKNRLQWILSIVPYGVGTWSCTVQR